MNRLITFFSILFLCSHTFAQLVMKTEGITPENACKPNQVYFLLSDRAKPVEPIDSIESRINREIRFVRENPTFESKPSVQLVVNCKGELGGGFHNVTKSGNEELDKELIEFFKTVTIWKPGKLKKKTVDSWYMWRMEIKDGYIDILN